MFVAGRSINVKRDGAKVALNPGDPCPEAATWDHDVLLRCMKIGQVVNVEKPTAKAVSEAAAQTAAALASRTVAAKNAGQTSAAAPVQAASTSKMPKAPAKKSTSKMPKKTAA